VKASRPATVRGIDGPMAARAAATTSLQRGKSRLAGDESGAILLLAVIFILIIAMSVLGLLTFGGTGIKNAANLQGQRNLEYAGDGATSAAIQGVRYSSQSYSALFQWPSGVTSPSIGTPPTAPCLPNGASDVTIDNDAMVVSCIGSLALPVPQQNTRIVTFYACLLPSGVLPSSFPCSSNDDVVAATVDFQDVSSSGVYDCSDSSDDSTCGTGLVVTSWTVNNLNMNND
jgi:hypothetical protein